MALAPSPGRQQTANRWRSLLAPGIATLVVTAILVGLGIWIGMTVLIRVQRSALPTSRKRLLIGGKSRALILNESRIHLCESPDEAPKDGFRKDAFNALAIPVSEVAVMLRNQPALLRKSIDKLLAGP